MKSILLSFFLIQLLQPVYAELTGTEILKKVDDLIVRTHCEFSAVLDTYKKKKLVKRWRFVGKIAETDEVLFFFSYPPKHKDKKYLSVGNNMWVYHPNVNKVLRMSQKQRFSASDFSNADILRNRLSNDYSAKLVKTEIFKGNEVYKLELKALSDEIPYARVEYWIRKKDFVPLQRNFYAMSGHLLKILRFSVESNIFNGMPDTLIMTNLLAKGRKSIFKFTAYKENQTFPKYIFRKDSLKR